MLAAGLIAAAVTKRGSTGLLIEGVERVASVPSASLRLLQSRPLRDLQRPPFLRYDAGVRDPTANQKNVARHGWAWVALSLALALHVTDEAATDFLSVYNPAVEAIKKRAPYLPLPTFTFDIWLAGLIVAIVVLLTLSLFVFRGARLMIYLSYPLAFFMLLNGLGHIAGSFYLGRWMPGVYSSPVLLAASIYLWACARRRHSGLAGT